MNEEYEQRQFWENKLPVYRITEVIDFKIVMTSEPIYPWQLIKSQDNGH